MLAQVASHATWQQKASWLQTQSSHGQAEQPGVLDAVQPVGLPHPPQSILQRDTHWAVHCTLQQVGLLAQTQVWHGQLQQPFWDDGRQPPLMQE